MATLDVYLTFDGTCAEAMRYYERVLGGKLDPLMTFGESPMCKDMPAVDPNRIMHAHLLIGGRSLMASDSMGQEPYQGMKGISLTLTYPTPAEAQRVFDALGEGGRVTMPMQKTFWAEAFGMLVDRFGTPWMVNGAMSPP
jgi:PhnB protein